MKSASRNTLVERCLRGDRSAQEALYRREVRGVYHLIVRLVNDRRDAEDLTQECFVKVFTHLERFRGEAALSTWIKRIAINLSLAHLRRDRPLLVTPSEEHFSDDSLEMLPTVQMDEVHRAIKALPEGCRVVLTLHLLEGYRQTEIADILDVSLGTVKSQYWRAKKLLRKALRPQTERHG
ncbi:MAG: sigma-70 family RNA polymerase sigma factor [Bacteroidota bacterium]